MHQAPEPIRHGTDVEPRDEVPYDAVVVGAGFAGLYALKKLRDQGLSVRLIEAGSGVGGTWYHNRYPGARCDIESLDYSYSFDEALQQEWTWTERYASQPELLAYLNHVADRFDLRRDITLDVRIETAEFDEASGRWTLTGSDGSTLTCRYAVMATGVLSVPREPNQEGLETFAGEWYHTSDWPKDGVDLTGKRVAIIGTGSSAVQMIPIVAQQAQELLVFQRTPNFTMPAQNHPMDHAVEAEWKAEYPERRAHARTTYAGHNQPGYPVKGRDVSAEERADQYERRWNLGGLHMQRAFPDIMIDEVVNSEAAEFVRDKIRGTVHDPYTAEALMPHGFPLGTKRLCSGTGYYETFNRDDVELIDAKADPIQRITPRGVSTASTEYEVDVIVFATGFHAMTGALERIDPVGRSGRHLHDHWIGGPRTYLGVAIHGFPNMFVIAGPGSPSVISNMVCSIEQHVEWTADAIAHLEHVGGTLEARSAAEDQWVAHVNDAAAGTLFSHASASWYYADDGKGDKLFMPYVGGVGPYWSRMQDEAASGYNSFEIQVDPATAAHEERVR